MNSTRCEKMPSLHRQQLANESFRMSSVRNILADILLGSNDQAIRFDELCRVVRALGFDERIRGSHHIFTKENIDEIINLQPKRGLAKPYQVRQVRQLIHKYRLELP